jgi:hypothetical protein
MTTKSIQITLYLHVEQDVEIVKKRKFMDMRTQTIFQTHLVIYTYFPPCV